MSGRNGASGGTREGGAVATRGVDREREKCRKRSKGIKSDGEKQRNGETALFTVD